MIQFGIKSLDEIISQDRNVYILNRGFSGTAYANYEMRFCEYGLLKNLLDEGSPCGVIHMSYGDTYRDMYQRCDGWKAEYLNPNINSEEFYDFNTQASERVINYPLYELKMYGNDKKSILDYINNFLVGKVKYIFITNYQFYDSQDINIINSLFEIADKTGIVFILRTSSLDEFPQHIAECVIEFNKDKKTQEIIATCTDNNGNLVNSKPMKYYKNNGMGYIK